MGVGAAGPMAASGLPASLAAGLCAAGASPQAVSTADEAMEGAPPPAGGAGSAGAFGFGSELPELLPPTIDVIWQSMPIVLWMAWRRFSAWSARLKALASPSVPNARVRRWPSNCATCAFAPTKAQLLRLILVSVWRISGQARRMTSTSAPPVAGREACAGACCWAGAGCCAGASCSAGTGCSAGAGVGAWAGAGVCWGAGVAAAAGTGWGRSWFSTG